MASTNYYSMSNEDIEINVNSSKNVLLSYLVNNGYINEEQYYDLKDNHAFIIKKASFFSKIFSSITKKEENRCFILVKQLNLVENKEEAPSKEKGAILSLVKDKDKSKEEQDE